MGDPSPAFSFYAKDFMLGTAAMSLAERGAYITLLAYQWDTGAVPDDPAVIGRVCGCTRAAAVKVWAAIGPKFQRGPDGYLRNSRLECERAKQAERRATLATYGKKGAESRWNNGQADGQADGLANGLAIIRPMAKRWPGGGLPDPDPDPDPDLVLRRSYVQEQYVPSVLPEPAAKVRSTRPISKGKRLIALDEPQPSDDPAASARAARFLERYREMYPRLRKGAFYAGKPTLDFVEALQLVNIWDDERLDKIATVFLTTDDDFCRRSSTIAQLRSKASWCDLKLREADL